MSDRIHMSVLAYGAVGSLEGKAAATSKDFKVRTVLLPPLAEQKKIAAILSSVDEAIQATEAVIEQTRRVKDGLLQDLLTRGIGHTRFKQTEIGEIPESWEVRQLGMWLASTTALLSNLPTLLMQME